MNFYMFASWLLIGFALSTSAMMHFWLPDPPPPNTLAKYAVNLIAGGVGAVIGGSMAYLAWTSSDPMPGLVAAAAGALFFSGAAGLLTGAGQGAATRSAAR
jgi:hypothetical protein